MTEVNFQDLQEAKDCLESYEQSIKEGEKLKRLLENPDFKDIILEGFCTKACSDYIARSVNQKLSPDVREMALIAGKAGGCLKNYLQLKMYYYSTASNNIEELRNYIEEESNKNTKED